MMMQLDKIGKFEENLQKKFVANTELLDGWKVHFRKSLTFTFQRLIEKVQCLFLLRADSCGWKTNNVKVWE